MSSSGTTLAYWNGEALVALDHCDPNQTSVLAADSWLVTDGTALAIDLHRERFSSAVDQQSAGTVDATAFWDAALEEIPREGDQFPRVELQTYRDGMRLVARQRTAPRLGSTVTLATHEGADPRTRPLIKGPASDALLRARTAAQARGADEAVLLSEDGFVAEGAYSAIVWWKGNTLCLPSREIPRVDSVTVRSVAALATALGVELHYESARPDQLGHLEIWALSALHGIRLVTRWIDGPTAAAEPGRLQLWRSRLHRLRKPLPTPSAG